MSNHPEDSSCDLPGAAPPDDRRFRHFDGSRWEGVTPQVYKLGSGSTVPGASWRDVVRHTLIGGGDEQTAFHLRYFEIAPSGYSSLEKHRHVHAIIVLRGSGRVVAGHEVFDVVPFDFVYVPPGLPHQFVNTSAEPFGFLCPVDADRDPPQPLTESELTDLLQDPTIRAAVRVPERTGSRHRD